jgi:hypothetical protein
MEIKRKKETGVAIGTSFTSFLKILYFWKYRQEWEAVVKSEIFTFHTVCRPFASGLFINGTF